MKPTKYSNFCEKIFGERIAKRFKDGIEEKNIFLVKADIPMLSEEYYSLALMNSIIGAVGGLIFSLVLFVLAPSAFTMLLIFLFTLLTPLFIAGFYLYLPTFSINKRADNIDLFLPYAINLISSMAVAGISPADIFQTLATISVYGEVQTEAKKIAKEIAVMGVDNITAIKHAIDVSPSRKFKSFLQGIIGTIQSGSELHIYLGSIAKKYMDDDLTARKRDLDLLALIAEVLVLALIAFPIFLVIILTVMGFFGGSIETSTTILLFFSFIILPIMYAFFYLLITSTSIEKLTRLEPDKNLPLKQYFRDNKKSFTIFLVSLVTIIILFSIIQLLGNFGIIDLNIYVYWDFAFLAALIALGPIGIYNYLEMKRKKDMQDRLPDFLTEVGDSLSTGMNIFESIKVAEKGHYGKLNPEITIMKTQISWNISMKYVLFDFAKRMKTAIVERIVIALDKGLVMGGNTPKIFKAVAAEVDQINQIEFQRKSSMSVYALVMMVCFFVLIAIVVILNQTIFQAFFEIQALQAEEARRVIEISVIDPLLLNYSLYSFVFVQSLCAGVLAGFMMDGKLSSGIRFGGILGIIAIIVFKTLITSGV